MMFDTYPELFYVLDKMQPILKQRLEQKGFVLLNWGWQYLSWQSGARLITGSNKLPGWHSHPETHAPEREKRAAG